MAESGGGGGIVKIFIYFFINFAVETDRQNTGTCSA